MEEITSQGDASLIIPLPSSSMTLSPSIISSDNLWRWTISFVVEGGQVENTVKVFCTAYDIKYLSSTRLVQWGGTCSLYTYVKDGYSVRCQLASSMTMEKYCRKLSTAYAVCSFKYQTSVFPNNLKMDIKLYAIQSLLQPEPKPKPKPILSSAPVGSCLSKSLGTLLQSGLMSDVRLLCTDGQEIPAHRLILAARSEFFNVKFKPEWDGHTVDVSVDLPILKEMLRYIYTDSLGDNVDLVKLLVAADMYLIPDLCGEVTERLKKKLSSNNQPAASVCCDLLKTSATHNSPSLWSVVLNYLKLHRDQILKSKEWAEFQVANRQVAAEAVLDTYNLPN